MVKKIEDMDMFELKDRCRDEEVPYKDASSADELRERLAPKKAEPKKKE